MALDPPRREAAPQPADPPAPTRPAEADGSAPATADSESPQPPATPGTARPEQADQHPDRTSHDGQWVRTSELRPLLAAMNALRDGDFTTRVPSPPDGGSPDGVLADMIGVLNQIIARNAHLSSELQRVRGEVIRQGRLDERISASPGQGPGRRTSTRRTPCWRRWWSRSPRPPGCWTRWPTAI